MSFYDNPGLASAVSEVSAHDSDSISDSSEFLYTPPGSDELTTIETDRLNSDTATELMTRYTDRVKKNVDGSCNDAALHASQLLHHIQTCRDFFQPTLSSDPESFDLIQSGSRVHNNMIHQLERAKYLSSVPNSYAIDNNISVEHTSKEDHTNDRVKSNGHVVRVEQEKVDNAFATRPSVAPNVECAVNELQNANLHQLSQVAVPLAPQPHYSSHFQAVNARHKPGSDALLVSVSTDFPITKLMNGEEPPSAHCRKQSTFSSLRMGEKVQDVRAMISGAANTTGQLRSSSQQFRTHDNSPDEKRSDAWHEFYSYKIKQRVSHTAPNAKVADESQHSDISSTIQRLDSKIHTADETVENIDNAQQKNVAKSSSAFVPVNGHESRGFSDCEKQVLESYGLKECLVCRRWVRPSPEGRCSTCSRSNSHTLLNVPTENGDFLAKTPDEFQDPDGSNSLLSGSCSSLNDQSTVADYAVDEPDTQDDASITDVYFRAALKTLGLSEYSSVEQKLLALQLLACIKKEPERNLVFHKCYSTIARYQTNNRIWETVLNEEEQPELKSKTNSQGDAPETQEQDACVDCDTPLERAYKILGLEQNTSVNHEIVRDSYSGWMHNTSVRTSDAPSTYRDIYKHQDQAAWDLVHNWDKEMDQNLIYWKNKGPTTPWAVIGKDLGVPGTVCKKRFAKIKPKGWKLIMEKTTVDKDVGQETKAHIKSIPPRVDASEQGDSTDYQNEEGWSCGARSSSSVDCKATTDQDPRILSREETPTSMDTYNSRDHTSSVSQHASTDACSLPPNDHNHDTSQPGAAESTTSSTKNAWPDLPIVTNDEHEDKIPTVATRAPTPGTYTVTYHATIKSGDKELRIPINSRHVSDPNKTILDNGMRKVWRWVQDKGLGEKISLQDAFALAKDIHGGDEDEDEGSENVDYGEDGEDEGGEYLEEEKELRKWRAYCL